MFESIPPSTPTTGVGHRKQVRNPTRAYREPRTLASTLRVPCRVGRVGRHPPRYRYRTRLSLPAGRPTPHYLPPRPSAPPPLPLPACPVADPAVAGQPRTAVSAPDAARCATPQMFPPRL